ncbi:MAG: hypothetical protein WBW33_01635, partial [Bryobacteraceae bacterium]
MTTPEPTQRCTFVTFYSYKGGTGRSMALANVACLLGQELAKSGGKVCVIDWDLEAPGLHRYFPVAEVAENADRPGIIDYFADIRQNLDDESYQKLREPDGWRVLDEKAPLFPHIVENAAAGVDLIKAGRFGPDYADRVASFDWADFYRSRHEVFTVLRDLLGARYQWCLIDSRTGLSDVSGVCTMLMPEKLVAAFTPNRQSVDGMLDLVNKAVEYRRRSNDPRPLAVFPLPSRIVTEEHKLLQEAQTTYRAKFEQCFQRAYGIGRCDLGEYFEEVAIPHKGFYGFAEQVAVRDDASTTDALSINRAYERFHRRLVALDCAWDKDEATGAAEAVQAQSFQYDVFLSYSHRDREWIERFIESLRLITRLKTGRELRVFRDDGGHSLPMRDWNAQIRVELEQSAIII